MDSQNFSMASKGFLTFHQPLDNTDIVTVDCRNFRNCKDFIQRKII